MIRGVCFCRPSVRRTSSVVVTDFFRVPYFKTGIAGLTAGEPEKIVCISILEKFYIISKIYLVSNSEIGVDIAVRKILRWQRHHRNRKPIWQRESSHALA